MKGKYLVIGAQLRRVTDSGKLVHGYCDGCASPGDVISTEAGEELCGKCFSKFLEYCERRYGSITEVVDSATGHQYAHHARILRAIVAGYVAVPANK